MRLYCLASISQIPPPTDYIPPIPYDDGADELTTFSEYDGPIISFHFLPSDYRLTEICIGWKTFQDGPKKLYEIQIYQKNTRFLNFAMLRGLATVTYMDKDKGFFDLCLATSKECSFRLAHDIDLKIRAFCIRNTTTRGIVTPEEELAYINYAKQINDFCQENPLVPPENVRMKVIQKFGPLNLPNPSTPKVLKQKLTDFQTAVDLLCNPVIGSYSNITPTVYNLKTKTSNSSRIFQQVECLLYLKETLWHTKKPRTLLHEDKDKFRDCISLHWNNVVLNNKINFDAFNFQSLKDIKFKKVDLGKSMEFWYKLAAKINFDIVQTLYLQDCGIQILEDKFFETLSDNVAVLRLNDNDITFISKSISKLIYLYELNLNNNKNLKDDGFPWCDIPARIAELNLENTNISTVSFEVKNFKFLRNFIVKSPTLKNINWASFKRKPVKLLTMMKLNLRGDGAEINDEIHLKDIDTDDLKLINLKFKSIDFSGINFHSLSLINNGFENFNLADINYENLRILTISKNGLKTFSWSNIPKNIRSLDLSHNEIESITVADEEEIDFSVFTNLGYIYFKGNAINALPEGFENIPKLEALDLEDNCFGSDGGDLKDVLWHRVPKTLKKLYLSSNELYSIPCYLKNFELYNLNVSACNLHYICPYLHTKIQKTEKGHMVIDVTGNPKLELSFIPNTIFQLPKADVQPTTGKAHTPFGTPNHANFPTTTIFGNEKILRDTSRTKYNNKAVYEFKTDGIKNSYACKCCAMCGESTDEPLFKQQMAPDSILLIKRQKGSNDIKYGDFHGPFVPSVYYEPGQWRTKITSRLCVGCKKTLMAKIDVAFDKFGKNAENVVENKRTKNAKTNEVNEFAAPHLQPFYNPRTSFGPSKLTENVTFPPNLPIECDENASGPSTMINRLPPIDTFLYNHPQEIQHEPIGPHFYQSHVDTSWNSPMEYDPSTDMENISINNSDPVVQNPDPINFPPVSILLDQYGNQVAVWNSFSPTSIPNFNIPPPPMIHGPFQETFLNQSTATEAYDNSAAMLSDSFETSSSSTTNETLNGYHFQNL